MRRPFCIQFTGLHSSTTIEYIKLIWTAMVMGGGRVGGNKAIVKFLNLEGFTLKCVQMTRY